MKNEFETTIKHSFSALSDQHFAVKVDREKQALHVFVDTFDSSLMEHLLLSSIPHALNLHPYLDETLGRLKRQPYAGWRTYLRLGGACFEMGAALQATREADQSRLAITLTLATSGNGL